MLPEQLLTHKDIRIRELARYLINTNYQIEKFEENNKIIYIFLVEECDPWNSYIDIYFYKDYFLIFGSYVESRYLDTMEEVITLLKESERIAGRAHNES